MSDKRILVVEDDAHIAQLIKYNINQAGFECICVITGEDALEVLDEKDIDLIVLDIMLPKMDGRETCKLIKKRPDWVDIPIIMLTAQSEEVDRLLGLELGADDYMGKPFSPRELILRIKAILRRTEKQKRISSQKVFQVGDLTLDVTRHKVMIRQKKVPFTIMEFKLLNILMERRGRVQSREQLLEDVWNLDADVTTRTVDTHIKCLRKKLGKEGKRIETVRGIGYCFDDT